MSWTMELIIWSFLSRFSQRQDFFWFLISLFHIQISVLLRVSAVCHELHSSHIKLYKVWLHVLFLMTKRLNFHKVARQNTSFQICPTGMWFWLVGSYTSNIVVLVLFLFRTAPKEVLQILHEKSYCITQQLYLRSIMTTLVIRGI